MKTESQWLSVDSEAEKAPLAGVGRETAPSEFLTHEGKKVEPMYLRSRSYNSNKFKDRSAK